VSKANLPSSVVTETQVGAANGVAGLDNTGNVPATQLGNAPSSGSSLATTGTPNDRQLLRYMTATGKYIYRDPFFVDPKDFGAQGGTGAGVTLSSVYTGSGALAAAQAGGGVLSSGLVLPAYPFATSLSQTLDYCGHQAALNFLGTLPYGGHMHTPAGKYIMGPGGSLEFPNGEYNGVLWDGDGRWATVINHNIDLGTGVFGVARAEYGLGGSYGHEIRSMQFEGPVTANPQHEEIQNISAITSSTTLSYGGATTSTLSSSTNPAQLQAALQALTPNRTDTASAAFNTSTITDSSIGSSDAGRALQEGGGIPYGAVVGTVTAGTSFIVNDTNGVALTTYSAVTSVTLLGDLSQCQVSGTSMTVGGAGLPFVVHFRNADGQAKSLITVGTSAAATVTQNQAGTPAVYARMYGVQSAGRNITHDCMIKNYYAGLVQTGNHDRTWLCEINDNWYGVYTTAALSGVNPVNGFPAEGSGNNYLDMCDLTGNARYSWCIADNSALSGTTYANNHMEAAFAFGFERHIAANGTVAPSMNGVVFNGISFESNGNGLIFDEGQGSATLIGVTFIASPSANNMATYPSCDSAMPFSSLINGPQLEGIDFINSAGMLSVSQASAQMFATSAIQSKNAQDVNIDRADILLTNLGTMPLWGNNTGATGTPVVNIKLSANGWEGTVATLTSGSVTPGEVVSVTAGTGSRVGCAPSTLSSNAYGVVGGSNTISTMGAAAPLITRGLVNVATVTGFTSNQALAMDTSNPGYVTAATNGQQVLGYAMTSASANSTGSVMFREAMAPATSSSSSSLAPSAVLFTANGTYTISTGATMLEITCVGGGAGGGGGGSAASTQLQVGGGGGGPGGESTQLVPVGSATTLAVVIGGGGTAGYAGTAGGSAGGVGLNGGNTTVTGTGILVEGTGGSGGASSAGTSTNAVGGGIKGISGTSTRLTPTAGNVSSGGESGVAGSSSSGYSGAGGGGGGAATATLGGGGGAAGTANFGGANGTSGASSTTAGVNGTSAIANTGAGGGGGGGGNGGTSTGGAGGAGGSGFAIVKVVG
jgi:hypothetical protein